MAAALIHLFSSAAFDGQHDEMVSEDADGLLLWLAQRFWGDAMRVGRHDWVNAGCPVTVEDFCTSIRTLTGARFSSLEHVLTISDQPKMLISRSGEVSAAAVTRLEALVANPNDPHERKLGDPLDPSLMRQSLYEILLRYPSSDAVSILERCTRIWPDWDGDSTRSIGGVLAEALEKCHKTTI
jgi:hypothetical protein